MKMTDVLLEVMGGGNGVFWVVRVLFSRKSITFALSSMYTLFKV